MKIPLFFKKSEVVAAVAASGYFQSLIDYGMPLLQFLIAFFTFLFVVQRWLNELKKKKSE